MSDGDDPQWLPIDAMSLPLDEKLRAVCEDEQGNRWLHHRHLSGVRLRCVVARQARRL